MEDVCTRRSFLKSAGYGVTVGSCLGSSTVAVAMSDQEDSDFKWVYNDPARLRVFVKYLEEEKGLYLDNAFHSSIIRAAKAGFSDREIFDLVLSGRRGECASNFWAVSFSIRRKERLQVVAEALARLLGRAGVCESGMILGGSSYEAQILSSALSIAGRYYHLRGESVLDWQTNCAGDLWHSQVGQDTWERDTVESLKGSLNIVVAASDELRDFSPELNNYMLLAPAFLAEGGYFVCLDKGLLSRELTRMNCLAAHIEDLIAGYGWSGRRKSMPVWDIEIRRKGFHALDRIQLDFGVNDKPVLALFQKARLT